MHYQSDILSTINDTITRQPITNSFILPSFFPVSSLVFVSHIRWRLKHVMMKINPNRRTIHFTVDNSVAHATIWNNLKVFIYFRSQFWAWIWRPRVNKFRLEWFTREICYSFNYCLGSTCSGDNVNISVPDDFVMITSSSKDKPLGRVSKQLFHAVFNRYGLLLLLTTCFSGDTRRVWTGRKHRVRIENSC